MTPQPRPLTTDLLDRFAEASQRVGGPLLDVIEPGLSDDVIEELFAELGLSPPPELRVLWRWGVMPDRPANIRAWEIHPYFELLPPARAVKDTIERRNDPLVIHEPSWVAFAVEQAPRYLLVDTAHAGPTAPVVLSEEDGFVAALSMGDLFEYWAAQIENGGNFYDGRRWRQAVPTDPVVPLE